MDYNKEIQQIDNIIKHLRALKADYKKLEKIGERSLNASAYNSTPGQIKKLNTAHNWAAMNLDKQKRATWKTIVEAGLETSLEDVTYNPSGFHCYKQ